jgi:hypothetical protein
MYIKLPMYLFFYLELILNGFEAGKSITRGIGRGWAPEISTFLGPNSTRFACSHFMAQKVSISRVQPPPMPLVMDLARLKTITYRTI